MRPVQKFTREYLAQCESVSTEETLEFLEDFRKLHAEIRPAKSRLISLKVPEDLLNAFRLKARIKGVPYQTQIKRLMLAWIR